MDALIKAFIHRVQNIAFSIPAPNPYTPQFVQACVIAQEQICDMMDNPPLSREEAARICHMSISKNEDGSYGYSHSGGLPFDDIFACLKQQGWEPKPNLVSLRECEEAAAKTGEAALGEYGLDNPKEVAEAVLNAARVKYDYL